MIAILDDGVNICMKKQLKYLRISFTAKPIFIVNIVPRQKGEGQDLLILYKGHALIIEIKSGYEAQPHSVPKDARKLFEGILLNFKKNIQKGFEQTERVMKLFEEKDEFDIYDENDTFVYKVPTKRYSSVFSIIVTADKFRRAQIDLSHMLKLGEDSVYPFSVSINDLEIILLTLRKKKDGTKRIFQVFGLPGRIAGPA